MTNSAVASATYTVQQQKFTLTVTKTDLGVGTVRSSPAGISCGESRRENQPNAKEIAPKPRRLVRRRLPKLLHSFSSRSK
jgi:hypothetical protein